jgi:hypothetical protein
MEEFEQDTPRPPLGTGHAEAMLRLGLKELRNAFNPSPQSVADTEYGLYGTKTPGEVAKDKEEDIRLDRNEEPTSLDSRPPSLAEDLKARGGPQPERGPEPERNTFA